jgi:phosphatidylinositol alpha-1,6-mannosyltransferase
MKTMQPNKKILFLTLDAFSNVGGIQTVCKNIAFSLNSITNKSKKLEFMNLSIYDEVADANYIDTNKFHGFNGNKLSFLAQAFKRGISSQIILISHVNLLGVALVIKLLNRKSRIVMLAHGTEMWRPIHKWKKYFLNFAVDIGSVSLHTRQMLIAKHKIKSEKITILNGCLEPFYKVVQSLSKPERLLSLHGLTLSQPILLSVCRISIHDRNKGYDHTLNALPKILMEFPNLHYFMIGYAERSESIRIKSLIEKLGIINHVTILGQVPKTDLDSYYLLADVFVLPSEKEGFGLVFIEAASFGCIVISGDEDGSKEALPHGGLGVAVSPDAASIASQVAISLRTLRSPISRRKIINACIKQFNHKSYEDRIKQLLR